jgi:uncharacterized protein YggE
MRALRLIMFLAAGESLALAQLDSDTLTVSVSQTFSLRADQVQLSVDVNTGVNTGLDEVITKLNGAGITSAIFSNLSSDADPPALHWFFTLSVPVSEIKSTIAQLTGLKIIFYIQGLQISQQMRDAQSCSMSNLMASAQVQAKKMADAAELAVGDVLALSDEGALLASYSISVPPAPAQQWFRQASAALVIQPVLGSNCSLTVKFKLLRYH